MMSQQLTFANVLSPLTEQQFVDEYYGQTHCVVKGHATKLGTLLPWDVLSRVLSQHRLDYPRLRLVREGKNVPPESYMRYILSRSGAKIPRVRFAELAAELRNRAVLVLDSIDEIVAPITELARDMEQALRENVVVNAYAGWNLSRGFDLHWDTHEVFILQVAGQKAWRLHGTTYPVPLSRDVSSDYEKPTSDPIWEGVLVAGDLLYIPRGVWHSAQAMDGSALHLTFGVTNQTGISFLRWMCDELRSHEAFRRDLPRFKNAEIQVAHMTALRELVLGFWTDSALSRFFVSHDAALEGRDGIDLPDLGE